MRVPIWIPRTPAGLVVSVFAGLVLAGIVYLVIGMPPLFSARVGSKTYQDQMYSIILMLIVAVAGGSWLGSQYERIRESRKRQRSAVMNELFTSVIARAEQREQAARAAVASQPWESEALKRRELGRMQAARISTVWDGLDPYLCLDAGTLIRSGFTTIEEVDAVHDQVLSGQYPERWNNPMMLRDLELLEPRDNALMRIGVWAIHNPAPATP